MLVLIIQFELWICKALRLSFIVRCWWQNLMISANIIFHPHCELVSRVQMVILIVSIVFPMHT